MASRREEKERRRQERIERERAERARSQRQRRLYAVLVGAALVGATAVAVVAVATSGGGNGDGGASGPEATFKDAAAAPEPQVADLAPAARAAGCVVKHPPIEGRTHLQPNEETPEYGTDPPTSGNHDPLPAQDGVYSEAPKPRNYVHTMEHGRVVIQYKPSLVQKRVRQLGGLYNEDPYLVLLLPNAKMPYEVAASAWGHLIGCKKVTDKTFDALRAFRDRYRDQAPEPASSQPAHSA